MKNLENNMFEINKTTMRDLTPYEAAAVAGGAENGPEARLTPFVTVTIIPIITIITRDPC
jgi:hypothetical protein